MADRNGNKIGKTEKNFPRKFNPVRIGLMFSKIPIYTYMGL